MPWIAESDAFDFRLLATGALEYRDRHGRYQLAWGCNAQGWHEFWERLDLIRELLTTAPEDETIESLYLDHDGFRRHCDRCLELSGIPPDSVSPKLMRWLLFPPDDKTPSPLVALNSPYPVKHPQLLGGEPISNRVEFLAALAAVCDGNLAEAVELANTTPARDALAAMASRAWAQASQDDKDRAILSEAKRNQRTRLGGRKRRAEK